MSQFYEDFTQMNAAKAARQANGTNGGNFAKIGFFGSTKDAAGNRVKYMTNSGDSALVRINYDADSHGLLGAYLHAAGQGVLVNGRPFQKVECLKTNCPICQAIAAGDKRFGKPTPRVFIPMVIAYKQNDGTYTTPEPVVMDAASYMIEILVQTMGDFGPLKEHIFKLTRNGTGTDTRYSLTYIPTFDNENIITKASLDDFKTFDVSRHSYWVKSATDMTTFISTGAFPDVVKTETQTAPVQPTFTVPAQPAVNVAPTQTPNAFAAAEANPFVVPAQPARQPATDTTSTGTRDYSFQQNW